MLSSNDIGKSDFLDAYPFPLPEDKLKNTKSKTSLVKLVDSSESLSLIFCSSRYIRAKVKIDPNDFSPEAKRELNNYDELYGIKNCFHQFFDVVVLWKNKPLIEVRVDVTHEIFSQDRKKYALEVMGKFNKLAEKLLGIPSILKSPLNFFPLIKKLYDAKDEGKVGEIAFTTDEGSIKIEKMRVGMVDLRNETYHKAGKAAVDDICPYRLAILWESPISESLNIKNHLELFLQGNCRSLSSKKPVLEDVIIRKCSFSEEYKFAFERINKYLHDDG